MRRCEFALFMLLAGGVVAARADVAVLRGVRYSAGDSLSRVTLTLEGNPRYTGSLQGSTVRLGLSGTRIGPSPGESMFKFRDGLVRSVAIVRCPGDSVEILMVMREAARYRIVRDPSGNGLQVLAFRPVPPSASQGGRRSLPLKGIGTTGLAAPVPFVDIASIARDQVVESSLASNAEKSSPAAMTAGPSPIIGVLLIGITMLGGFVFLYLMLVPRPTRSLHPVVSQASRADTRRPRIAGAPAEEPAVARVYPKTAQDTLRSHLPEEPAAEEDQDEESYQLARSFSRGREEVLLARRFQEAPTITQQRITRVVSDEAGTTQRASAARKLGVGRGEVDLAMRLKGLQNGGTKKEEVL